MKKVTVILKQANASLTSSATIESIYIDEISGTVINNINQLRLKVKKYKMNLGGFSFNRKFEIEVSIDEQKGTLNKVLCSESLIFSTTLTDTTFGNFAEMMNDLITGMLLQKDREIYTFSEALEAQKAMLN